MSIEISNESGDDADEPGLIALARYVLDDLGVNPLAQLSIVLVDEPTMASLNERWMSESGPTDVLAFPMEDLDPGNGPEDPDVGVAVLGDVVLCPAVAARQAAEAGHPVADELRLLCAHGVLHLLGYDHAEPEEEHQMFALQDRLLASFRATRRAAEPRQ